MEWLEGLFSIHSAVQTVAVIAVIVTLGLALGKIRVRGISLGIAFVFFVGIMAGHTGLSIDRNVLDFAETFGLSLFVYVLGLHVGPHFFSSLRHEGLSLNIWSLVIIVAGTLFSLLLIPVSGISLPDMVGVLCGATTNTPALGAAAQAMSHFGLPNGSLALATAVTYPIGVVGVIAAMMIIRKFFVRPQDLRPKKLGEEDNTYIEELRIVNPAIDGKTVVQVAQMTHCKFIISRLWRDDEVIVPKADTLLKLHDKILVVTTHEDERVMELLFGEKLNIDWNTKKIDWNAIDSDVESRTLVVTRASINGKMLGRLKLRDTYGVNVSRITRGDIRLLATDALRLQYGDLVTVVGSHEGVNSVEQVFGNSVKTLSEPNVGSIFLGILLGLALGTIPFSIPGMSSSVRLGIAGGPIIMGILVGALGPKLHFISYTTLSASLMLRKMGLSIYLACLGLDAGKDFFATVIRPEGLVWVGIGALITIVPVVVAGIVALRSGKFDFATVCGIMCGSMANPMALGYANDTLGGDSANISYASVYPLGMFVRVVIAQVLIVFFVG